MPIREKLFDFAYGAGLHDATAQKAYQQSQKRILYQNHEAKAIVKAYLDAILDEQPSDFYTTADSVVSSFRRFEKERGLPERFSFGNAQKLINITVKFMYLAAYLNHSEMRKKFSICHCPLDRKMGEFVAEELKKRKADKSLPKNLQELLQSGRYTVFSGTWSRITEEDYRLYQASVCYLAKAEGVIPIEYDYLHFS